ncbi:MAG: prepilin-type N-terminal cleavage/methylation domain-containing protein [Acidobacteria bacterium]|nr:MAG: prepilin-type N-terminal cleavage/methylation domain-containing protein [Acidobacteriota bacterium]REK02264.1 MAG: prepilin-type N-terminal cleavage/methylation domain-containing protein [Acidobacteriota bacterium]REK13933.1 MAG: prepilin-type N-terminal cleavage/methylation domain-containing protein [Acidobacteriota bacterium]REK41927.1 MAG: prepilin-type N-terminal cleavage/methylation domain-containing protein [Acidobacteriota bacterium]
MKHCNEEKGFSLIELLLVVVIVALLATIALPSLLKSKSAAERAATIGTLKAIHANQTGFMSHKGRYATLSELNDYTGKTLGIVAGTTLIRGNYTFYGFPTVPADLRNQYQILAIRFKDHRIISALSLREDGRVDTLIDEL